MKISLDNFIRKSAPFLIILNCHAFSVPNKFTAKFKSCLNFGTPIYIYIYIYIESDAGVPDPSGDLGTRRLNAVVFGEIQSRLGAWGRNFLRSTTRGDSVRWKTARPRCCAPPKGSLSRFTSKSRGEDRTDAPFLLLLLLFFRSTARFAEPVASARPKLSTTINLIGLATNTNGSLPLFCPAQGFPLPSYR